MKRAGLSTLRRNLSSLYSLMIKTLLIATIATTYGALNASAITPQEIESASRAFESEEWSSARDAYARLVEDAEWNGFYWFRLAKANAEIGDLAAAEDSFLRMRETGFEKGPAAFEIAAIKVAQRDLMGASHWLKIAMREGTNNVAFLLMVDPRFAAAFEDDEFSAFFRPKLPGEASTAQKWRTDLDHLDRHYRLTHVDPFRCVSEARWVAALDALKAQASTASNAEMAVGLMRLMALTGDGHSMPFAPYGDDLFGVAKTPQFFTIAPIEFYDFDGEIRVIAADEEYADLVGARLERIGDLQVDEAYKLVKEIMSADNAFQKRWMAMRHLATPEILHALGIAPERSKFQVVVRTDSGRRLSKVIRGVAYEDGRFTRAVPALDELQIASAPEDRPLYLRNPEDPFGLYWVKETGILYLQINTLLNDRERTVEEFGRQIVDAIEKNAPNAVVIDLRWNSGGDSGFNKHIVNAIAGSSVDAPGRLFTIIGRRTFSAAVNLTSALKAYTQVILVGEPSGAGPNFIGETNAIFMPNTGMIVSVSNRRHQGVLSEKKDLWWTPDLPAEPTWNSYRDGVDPALQTIEQYLSVSP